eukprot:g19733.t1
MDDMLHGLSLLGPRIEQMSAHIEKLSNEVADQRTLLNQKADHAEMAQLRQQLNHLGHGMAQKIDQVDRDTQQFMESTAQRMNGLGDELDLKAASSSVDILEDRIAKACQAMDRKAEATAFRRLEEQVLQIGGYVETKAEMSQLQAAGEALKALEQDVCKMATANEMEWVKRQMKDLRLTCSERVFGTKMWPEKFRFWPKSWLLPAEVDELCTWLDKHKSDTVIVKPEGGSQGDGIFLVQNSSDLRLARFCTAKYETPTAANANEAYMHLTNYSVNKKSSAFKDEDPFNVHTKASKRPLSTLLSQMAAQEAAEGRTFDEEKLFRSFEEVCAVLLQAMAPVMKEEDEEAKDEDLYEPNCFQILGVDVLLDSALQPWLLEVNARPSMDISNPLRLSDAPPGTRRCVCRDMDGEEHCHVHSEVDVRVKRLVVDGALHMAAAGGEPPETKLKFEKALHFFTIPYKCLGVVSVRSLKEVRCGDTKDRLEAPEGFVKMDFDRYSPSEAQETLAAVARIFQEAGGSKKAFTTSGVRRTLANAVNAGMPAHEMDTLVTKWKHQAARQRANFNDFLGREGRLRGA